MPDPILTTHAGSLPRPEDLIALNERRAGDDPPDEAEYLGLLRAAVADVVARQRAIGIDLVNDGEYGHSMGQRYDYGSWWTYVFQRLGGVELTPVSIAEVRSARAKPGEIALASFGERRDFQAFAEVTRTQAPAPRCLTATWRSRSAVRRLPTRGTRTCSGTSRT